MKAVGRLGRVRVAFGVGMLVLAGCAGSHRADTPVRVDLSLGYAELSVPLRGHVEPLIVAAGRHVLVYGGSRFSHNNTREVGLDGGVDFDIDRRV